MACEIIVIGASWGGLSALRELVSSLTPSYPVPVVLIQHRHPDSGNMLAQLLQDVAALAVCDAEDKSPIDPGNVYVAPADYHLLIEAGRFVLSVDEPVAFSRPSIDLTFSTAADAYGAGAVGIVLTGNNADGSRGLRRIVARGGSAIVQRPDTAERAAMPAAAIAAVPTARVMSLAEIGDFLRGVGGAGRSPFRASA